MIREVKEETGLDIREPELCGVKQFYKLDGTRYIVFLYRTDQFSGELRSSEEGEVFWMPRPDWEKYTWVPDLRTCAGFLRRIPSASCSTSGKRTG